MCYCLLKRWRLTAKGARCFLFGSLGKRRTRRICRARPHEEDKQHQQQQQHMKNNRTVILWLMTHTSIATKSVSFHNRIHVEARVGDVCRRQGPQWEYRVRKNPQWKLGGPSPVICVSRQLHHNLYHNYITTISQLYHNSYHNLYHNSFYCINLTRGCEATK